MDRTSWWSPRAIGLHVTALVVVPGCIALCWWQVDRALSGNGLSWAYVFEWPFFAGYAVYLWWKLVHERPDSPAVLRAPGPEPGAEASELSERPAEGGPGAAESDEDAELAAYNRYLAALEANGRPKRW